MENRVIVQATETRFFLEVFLWREGLHDQNPGLGNAKNQPAADSGTDQNYPRVPLGSFAFFFLTIPEKFSKILLT